MKHRKNKTVTTKGKGVTKGAPSGVVISLIIHAVAFFVAGLFVVFKVYNPPPPEFEQVPAVERPKMPIKKPQVKVKSPSKPRSTPIRSKSMVGTPTIDIPDMGGMELGINTDLGGLDLLPDLSEVSPFGESQDSGTSFHGHLFDLKKASNGRPKHIAVDSFRSEVYEFGNRNLIRSYFKKYYKSRELFTTHFMVPPILADTASDAFNIPDMEGYQFIIQYEGDLVYKEDIRIRFWGAGSPFMMVVVDGKTVLIANADNYDALLQWWQSSDSKNRQYILGTKRMMVGDWIDLKAGEPLEMKVAYGEQSGGDMQAMLLVEVDGVEYPRNRQQGPILPAFKTDEFTPAQLDMLWSMIPEGECSLTNGPVFRDF